MNCKHSNEVKIVDCGHVTCFQCLVEDKKMNRQELENLIRTNATKCNALEVLLLAAPTELLEKIASAIKEQQYGTYTRTPH